MSRFSGEEPLRSEDSGERPRLRTYVLDRVLMQKGSLDERIDDREFDWVDERLSELFPIRERRAKVDLRLVEIPKDYTPKQVWEMVSTDPEYKNEAGELLWEEAKVEHAVAVDADSRLREMAKGLKENEPMKVIATGSLEVSGDEWDGYSYAVTHLEFWDNGEHDLALQNILHYRFSSGVNFLLLVRKSSKKKG